MNDDLYLFKEFEAVRNLVEKTHAEFVYMAETPRTNSNVYSSAELLEILEREGDRKRKYLLDNGPNDDRPGVYQLNEEGEIDPFLLYAQIDPGERIRRPYNRHLDL